MDEPTIQSYIEKREIVGSAEAGIVSDAETLAAKLSLLKATAEYDLKRVISFYGRIKAAKEFSSEYFDLIDLVEPSKRPDGLIWTDYVSGEMSAGDRKKKIQRLKKLLPDERGLLANARCLSEGVDVPSLDGVAFIDPKGSQIDIIQAVGRALRKSDEKKFGTIVLPVFIEPGDDEIERIESSNFKPVWDVLKALRSHDERLGENIDGIRTELGRRQKSRKTLPDNIIFDLPVDVGFEFSASLQTRLIESVSESWYFWYGLLQEYAEKCGNSAPPLEYLTENGWKLGVWVNSQRNKKERLSPEQCERLDDLGFIWNMLDEKWEQGFSALLKFYKRQGHCVVPISHKEDGYSLGNWVGAQRQNKDELSPERSQRLDDLGFVWDMLEHHFEEGFSSLEKFYQREGHCLVPRGPTKEIKKLARWVQNQREKAKF